MKTITRLLLTAVALGGAMSVQSCVEDPNQTPQVLEPNFPEAVMEKTIVEGEETTEFSIEPNQAWKVELQGEGAGSIFWIDDNGVPEPSISGDKAEAVKFSVIFSKEKEFDINRVCKVNLSMGGKSKVIAILTRPAENRTLNFKVAGVNAENTAFTEVYTEQESVELVCFDRAKEYARPVQILANYDWDLAIPDWCEIYKGKDLVEGALQGEKNKPVEVTVKAKMVKEIIGGIEGVLKVTDNSASDKYSEITVKFPDITKRVELTEANSTEFNESGQLNMGAIGGFMDQPAIAYVLSVEDVVFKALPWEGEWYATDFADWVTFESGWNPEGPALQEYDLSISVAPFEADGSRYVDVLVLPKSMDNADINTYLLEDASAIKEEYQPYLLNRFTQNGKMKDFLTPVSTPEAMAEVKATFVANHESWIAGTLDTKQVFELTYGMEWSCDEAYLDTAKPIDHYEVYDFDVNLVPTAEMADFWCTLWIDGESRTQIKVDMLPDACPTPDKMAFIALYSTPDATSPDAVIQCAYDENAAPVPSDGLITIGQGNGTITKLTPDTEWYMSLSAEFSTEEVYEVTTADFVLSLHLAQEYWNILVLEALPPFNDLADGSFSVESMGDTYVYVGESVTDRAECVLVFKDENGLNMAAVHFVYDPAAGGNSGAAPLEFAYPTIVENATLAPYEGDMNIFMGEFGMVDPSIVMQLTYTGPEMQAILNVPGLPFGEGPYTESPWLTYEVQGENQIMVNMANEPLNEVGYFVWYDDFYQPKAILVCTRTAIGWE